MFETIRLIIIYIDLLMIITHDRLDAAAEVEQHEQSDYWVEIELLSVNWKAACLTTGGCVNARFRIKKSSRSGDEIIAISWNITESLLEKRFRKFISHWTDSYSDDILVQCDVIGLDPLYGFIRTCDASKNLPILRELHESGAGAPVEMGDGHGRLLVEMRANCFNATLAVQKYMKQCPWCKPPEELITVFETDEQQQQHESQHSPELELYLGGAQALPMLLLILALFTFIGFTCTLVVIAKQRRMIHALRKHHHDDNNASPQHYYATPQYDLDSSNNHKYDIPWDQRCVLMPATACSHEPCGMADQQPIVPSTVPRRATPAAITVGATGCCGSNASFIWPTSSNNYRCKSLIAGCGGHGTTTFDYIQQVTSIDAPTTSGKHISANSSLSNHTAHEDSGLDSV